MVSVFHKHTFGNNALRRFLHTAVSSPFPCRVLPMELPQRCFDDEIQGSLRWL